MREAFIVAEISKNWEVGDEAVDLLSQRFEIVINTNMERGYRLVDWKTHVFVTENKNALLPTVTVNETIIAIFEKVTPTESKSK